MITSLLLLVLAGFAAQLKHLSDSDLLRRVLALADRAEGPIAVALLQVARVCGLPYSTQRAVSNALACVVDAVVVKEGAQ